MARTEVERLNTNEDSPPADHDVEPSRYRSAASSSVRTAFIQEIVPSYREPFFSRLAQADNVDLVVLSADADSEEGFLNAPIAGSYASRKLRRRITSIRGSRFVRLQRLVREVLGLRPDVVISVGNKGFLQNHVLLLLKRILGYRIYLLQHAYEYRVASRRFRTVEWLYTRYYLLPLVDGLIVYTQYERQRLIDRGVSPKKLWFTNNTLDIEEIRRVRDRLARSEAADIRRQLSVAEAPSIVFLGRLVRGKQVEVLLDYFARIRVLVPAAQLIIIGDGPLRQELNDRSVGSPGVVLTGAIYDERIIAAIMQTARAVFLPGYSGLSVNHAFAYGIPFVTLRSCAHKPEIDYVTHGENGYILEPDDVETNVEIMCALLTNEALFARMSRSAAITASRLTMQSMVENVAGVITSRLP